MSTALEPPPTSGRETPRSYSIERNIFNMVEEREIDDYKLPPTRNLVLLILGSTLHQTSAFMIVSSGVPYAQSLGGSPTFFGLVMGLPNAVSGLVMIPMVSLDGGNYKGPILFSYVCVLLGGILYGLAYQVHVLYLILASRIVTGIGFTAFMYFKRYCTDPRVVGVRRRTALASWLIVAQGIGLALGPYIGGLLYKVGFPNRVFNGYTGPGWLIASTYVVLTAMTLALFQDPAEGTKPLFLLRQLIRRHYSPRTSSDPSSRQAHVQNRDNTEHSPLPTERLSWKQKGVLVTMLWFAMTNYFILSGFETNIPVYTSTLLNYSPYNAGNFIAAGAIVTFPFLLVNMRYSRLIQDRVTLALGCSIGTIGLVAMMVLLRLDRVTRESLFLVWVLVALGFNVASTCTLSLLSKQLPAGWNNRLSMAIQYSTYVGRVLGALWGGAGVTVGMDKFIGLHLTFVGIGTCLYLALWKNLKAKTG
ncbi:major facilitator superfamily domain-containing protein [Flagelloscypha sp. PMI_526]|nr:major facilitator superfamily domain-containing protein [Flagelloscypha sp. PMI_526]